jgi:hypothetical protein
LFAALGLFIPDAMRRFEGLNAAFSSVPTIQEITDEQVRWRLGRPRDVRQMMGGRSGRFIMSFALLALIPVYVYGLVLKGLSRQAIRRLQYTADRVAARLYGSLSLLRALIHLAAVEVELREYLPSMASQFSSGLDRHDFRYQFLRYWEPMRPERREYAYAKAVTLFRAVTGEDMAYHERYASLNQAVGLPQLEQDERSASVLLPQAADIARELTAQLVRYWVKWDEYVVE